ncbi:hypothetical protein VB779_14290 [Haloarculaceae archaeon H-GB11]|nr:hypothetical protein [Haloarculaceae archaeon H-GB1-1]MEA5388087.1 hypothetical protein [Haloarculaceae archaeon H-GB11]
MATLARPTTTVHEWEISRSRRTEEGDGKTVEVTGIVVVWEFLDGMDPESFRADTFPVFERVVTTRDVTGTVTVVNLDDPCNDTDACLAGSKRSYRAR